MHILTIYVDISFCHAVYDRDTIFLMNFSRALVIVLPCYGALEIVSVIIIIFYPSVLNSRGKKTK